MKHLSLMIFVLIVVLSGASLLRGEEAGHAHHADDVESSDDSDLSLLDMFGDDSGIGGFLFPHLHSFGVFGDSTADPADLAVGDHDPNRNGTLQSLEPSLALRAGMLQGYVNASGTTDSAGDFTFALEEGFLELGDLPFGFKIRGGQFLNRFGFQNSLHNHDWKFVDQNLVNGRFLNEGELASQGGEISWRVPLPMMQDSLVSLSVGGLPVHGHGEVGHGHGEESEFESEGGNFTSTLVTANWRNEYDIDDERRLVATLSGAWGDNRFGRKSQVYGTGIECLWREHDHGGHGGRSLRWRTEAMVRHIGAVSGHLPGEEEEVDHEAGGHEGEEVAHPAGFDEFGIYSMLAYGINEHIETGIRGGWVSGISRMALDERYRLSPTIAWRLNEERALQVRLQYNWDHLGDSGSEHSIWFQIGFNWESGGIDHDH